MEPAEETVRVDVWLWRARFFKSRSLASKFVRDGRVRCGDSEHARRLARPSAVVRPGDILTFARNGGIMCVRIARLGDRRGPPAEAQTLYDTVEADKS